MTESGLGTFIEQDSDDALYGHTGGIGGYLTYMYYWRADRLALVTMVNQFDVDLRNLAGYGWSVPLGFEHP